MFEKTLTDVVKGIRASKRDTALYISQCIAECKTEINSSDMYVKANALQKLTFLQMMGYSMNWASFATIEVMSSSKFAHKRIGYLAASQGFTQDTEVILLTTNLLKKELRGGVGASMNGVYEAGLAINCISNIVTEDLARDLLPEVTNLTSHGQPYLRKKAILCLFKLFVQYPQGLRLTFSKLQQCLEDKNQSVVSCAVNVITELSDKNPKNYLHLAPAFFDLLTNSSNNWMLIKVVKLLGSLVPEEPRLARKLLEPLADIVKNTQAKSLLYESVHTITLCLPYCRKSDGSMPPIVPDIVTLCATTLRNFVEDTDQNLKYLGLVGFGSLMQSHPRVLSAPDYRPLILACLSDEDVTIRTRALDLLTGMATRKNLIELVSQLMQHVQHATGSYKQHLVVKIIEMSSAEKYTLLQDFEWYLDILFQLGHTRGIESHADLIRLQIQDVALRVLPVRGHAVRRSTEILLERSDGATLVDAVGDNGRGRHITPEILPGVAWIVGEYADLIRDNMEEKESDDKMVGMYHALVQTLTAPLNTKKFPTSTQSIYIQAAMKVFAAASADSSVTGQELQVLVQTLHTNLPVFMQSTDVAVVERSFTAIELLRSLNLVAKDVSSQEAADDSGYNDDLLNIGGSGSNGHRRPTGSMSLDARVREASDTLNFLLKPSPMKPVGAKVQRKKHSTPKGLSLDLNEPVNLAVFQEMIDEEEEYRANTKLSMASVTFTQQTPLQVQEPVLSLMSSGLPMDHAGPSTPTPPTVGLMSGSNASTSFQNSAGASVAPVARPRQNDPFYLDSTPALEEATAKAANKNDSRFGMIQLLDSDEEDNGNKKKKPKKKKEKKQQSKESPVQNFNDPFGIITASETTSNAPITAPMPSSFLYESDDDDDDDDEGYRDRSSLQSTRRKKRGKEFDGLAKVDLTTPLREDEVMPQRKHHVVADRPTPESKKSGKEKKKSSKSKKKTTQAVEESSQGVGDLLDLFGSDMASMPSSTPAVPEVEPTAPAASAPVGMNPINSAFDDLLGFSDPSPVPLLAGATFPQLIMPTTPEPVVTSASPTKLSSKRPWMKATIKSSSGSSSSPIDWSRVALLYRVYRSGGSGRQVSATAVFQLNNNSALELNNVTLELKDCGSHILGNVGAESTSRETNKIAPLTYSETDSSLDVKGSLQCAGQQVSVKLSLPACMYLEPESNLTIENVGEEVALDSWYLNSCKIDLVSGQTPEGIRDTLSAFLRAGEVLDGSASPLTGTLAAKSAASGARVRAMLKIKEGQVKVDLKCTSKSLGKALASDLKRLVL